MPMPWTTRQPMRKGTDWASPAATDPSTKTTIALWTSTFLLKRSASLPQIGVLTVVASREAVMTHVYCRWLPASLPMIVGSAVETIVDEMRAVKRAAMRPVMARRISLCVICPGTETARCSRPGLGVDGVVVVVSVSVMRAPSCSRAGSGSGSGADLG